MKVLKSFLIILQIVVHSEGKECTYSVCVDQLNVRTRMGPTIHPMQIWQATWSLPGTRGIKARLVGPLTNLSQKRLASSMIWSVLF